MAGLGSLLCNWKCHSSTVVVPATTNPHYLQRRQEQLWEHLFSSPSEWWDNRHDKKSPRHPDFRHKDTREPLWLNHLHKPLWVDSKLHTLDAYQALSGYAFQSLCEEGQLNMALDALYHMDQLGTSPSASMYWSILKACSKNKALTQAKQVSAHLARHPLQPIIHTSIGEYVVITLAKCGGLDDALHVFHMLPLRTVFAWTAMISGYTECGKGQEALNMYQSMREEGVEPNGYTFVSLFRACASIPDLEVGKRLHIEALKYRCDSDLFVSAALMDMYAKCGSITHAQNVFDGLSQHNAVSWTTMLSAYVEHGQAKKALQLYKQMQDEDMSPDEHTFVSALQACCILAENEEAIVVDGQSTKVMSLETGRAIHADAQSKGFHSHTYVGNTLVSMYGKCGSIVEAESVFRGLSLHTVVSWTAMLTAYVEQGEGEKVLQLYRQMQDEGVSANERTFVIMLQACCTIAEEEEPVEGQPSFYIGQALHADSQKQGYHSDVFVGNTLMSMYAKCGNIFLAENVFGKLPERSVVSWNSMLSGYIDQGEAGKALQLYAQMQRESVSPSQRSFVIAIQACCILAEMEEALDVEGRLVKVMSLQIGQALHDDARSKRFDKDIFVGNSLVSMYGKCGSIFEAQTVFDGLSQLTVVSWNALLSAYGKSGSITETAHLFSKLPQHNVVSWNAMLSAYVEWGEGDKALELYRQIQQERVIPTDVTFVLAVRACCMLAEDEEAVLIEGESIKAKSLEVGRTLHVEACRMGFDLDIFVGSTLVSMYGKCGNIMEAENVFIRLPQHNVASWGAMVSAYTELGKGEKALHLFRQMLKEGSTFTDTVLLCILQACIKVGSIDICRHIHFTTVFAEYELNLPLANTLIHAYGSCAGMVDALAVFETLPHPDVVSWNALIAAYSRHGGYVASLKLLEEMKLADTKPDRISFLSALSACTHAGLLDIGVECFECMSRDYDVIPEIEHYGTMADLLGRAGDFKKVEDMLSKMPMQPDWDMWMCLLGACHWHSNVKFGEQAFYHAVHLQPKQAAAYVLMSNIYADAGLHDCAHKVDSIRQKEVACE